MVASCAVVCDVSKKVKGTVNGLADHSYGSLRVAVRTAGGALPVSRAIVTIKDQNEKLLAVFFTDENGNTPLLKVLAPPKENTESPNAAGAAYYLYNVDTDKNGFKSVRNIGVPVYSGVTSVQPVELVPVSDGGEGERSVNIRYNESAFPDL